MIWIRTLTQVAWIIWIWHKLELNILELDSTSANLTNLNCRLNNTEAQVWSVNTMTARILRDILRGANVIARNSLLIFIQEKCYTMKLNMRNLCIQGGPHNNLHSLFAFGKKFKKRGYSWWFGVSFSVVWVPWREIPIIVLWGLIRIFTQRRVSNSQPNFYAVSYDWADYQPSGKGLLMPDQYSLTLVNIIYDSRASHRYQKWGYLLDKTGFVLWVIKWIDPGPPQPPLDDPAFATARHTGRLYFFWQTSRQFYTRCQQTERDPFSSSLQSRGPDLFRLKIPGCQWC